MELYIPPPMTFLPRLPPPRPAAPPVPVVPIPDLPEVIHAPEGAYTLNKEMFPSIGTPVAPLPYENRPLPSTAATMLGGAGGFIIAPPASNAPPPGQTAMSWGTTVVNGQAQPAHPVRFSFVNVYFPPKAAQQERSFGAMIGMGGDKGNANGAQPAAGQTPQQTLGPGYEPSVSSDSEPSTADMPPIPIMEVPLTALPNAQTSKRNVWGRSTTVAPNTLAALPRPKTNLRSSNSTFVTRLQAADNLPKIIADRGKGANAGEWVRWGFWNLGRTFGWGEEGGKQKDPFARVTFSHVPTCHAVSHITAGPERLDIIIGFTSGDIVWLDFIVGKYSRINKGGLYCNSSVTSVQFHPLQPHHFTAAFANGTFMQFNLFAEDPVTTISASSLPWEAILQVHDYEVGQNGSADASKRTSISTAEAEGTVQSTSNGNGNLHGDSSNDDEPLFEDKMTLWRNEDWAQLKDRAALAKKKGPDEGLSPWAGKNPVAVYKIGAKPARSTAYSPDGRYLAIASEDGMLRLVDTTDDRLVDTFAGYYAALNCVAWSPDSKFVAVGGQDDLIAIYSPRESRLVARCQGHSAFVTCIAFDPTIRTGGYRFASVGEDAKLVLWDFTAAALHRPRHHVHHANSSHHRISTLGSSVSLPKTSAAASGPGGAGLDATSPSNSTSNANPALTSAIEDQLGPRFHPAPPRSDVALLQPVFARIVEGNLLTSVHMGPAAIVTVGRAAGVKFWQRPPRQGSGAKGKEKKSYAQIKVETGRERERVGRAPLQRGQSLVGA